MTFLYDFVEKKKITELHRFLKPIEASKVSGLSTKTLARYADDGKLRLVKSPGGRRMYDRTEIVGLLKEFMDSRESA